MPLRTHERPNLPYEAKPKRNSQRYQLLSARDQPPTAEMLDGDADYVIDSMDVLSQDIQNVQAGAIIGSDNPDNANKLLTTDGNSVAWTLIRSDNMEDTAVTRTKLGTGAVSTNKLEDGAVTNPKLGLLAVAQGNMKDNSVGSNQIIDKNVTTKKLADRAATEDKIADLAISSPKLKPKCVTNPKMDDACVNTRTLANGAVTVEKLADQVLSAAIFPVGVVLQYAVPGGDVYIAPAGWLFCDGRSVLRASYPGLYDLLRDTYGSTDSQHFNLPDLRGRCIFGYVGGSTYGRITEKSTKRSKNGLYTGGTGGAESHKLTVAEMPKHRHEYNEGRTFTYQAGADQRARYPEGKRGVTSIQGGGASHNNMPPFILMSYIIKT